MMKAIQLIAVGTLMWVCALVAHAAIETLDGTEEGFWANRAVIVGRVASGSFDEPNVSINVDVMDVIASDIVVPNQVTIEYSPGRGSAVPGFRPNPGETFVMCIERKAGTWILPSAYITFLESRSPVQRIEGVQDPKLQGLIGDIQEIRSMYFRKHTTEK